MKILHAILVVYPDRNLACLPFQGFANVAIMIASCIALYYIISPFLMVHSIWLLNPS
jgi:hypothetical protein